MSKQQGPQRQAHIQFHGLAAGGEAVGRDEGGKTVFVPFAAPGDVALVQIESEKNSFARGTVLTLETASGQRVEPPCPQFRPATPHQSCGGCSWQHVALDAQRAAKREIVQNALTRIGGQSIEVEACRGGDGFRYRNKGDFVIGGPEIGFFAAASHDLVPALTCPIQRAENEEILQVAREILSQHPQWGFDASTGRGFWRRLVARVGRNSETLVTLVTAREARAECLEVAALLRQKLPHLIGVLQRPPKSSATVVWGRDYLIEVVNGLEFRVTGDAFWQVNSEVSPLLVQTALEIAAVQRGERALDLFCGAGLFALHLARAGAIVSGIETHQGAIRDATFNAQQNGLKATFRSGDAARELKKHKAGEFDLILLDPPRAGAAECLEQLIRLAPPKLVYVSCDPATLARDAKVLSASGYTLQRAVPLDLFPQTAHVETASLFLRS